MTSYLDELTHETLFTYDGLNRLTSATDPLLHTTSYTYDALGNLLTETDAEGSMTEYRYDSMSRLQRVIATAPGMGGSEHPELMDDPNTTFAYTLTGLLAACDRPLGPRYALRI